MRARKPSPPSTAAALRPAPRHIPREVAIADRARQLDEVAGLGLTPPTSVPFRGERKPQG